MSRSGIISSNPESGILSIELDKGTLHRTSGDSVQSIAFNRYNLTLPLQTPKTNPLGKVGRSTMSMDELRSEAGRHENKALGVTFLNEYHKRLALPISCFILTLLGFPLGFLSTPRHRTIGISLGLIIFILYYILLTAAKTVSEALVMPAGVAMWLPNLLFLILTVLFIRKVASETHTAALEKFYDYSHAFFKRFHLFKGRSR
jgi:lipopolysaccharide export system permease protein